MATFQPFQTTLLMYREGDAQLGDEFTRPKAGTSSKTQPKRTQIDLKWSTQAPEIPPGDRSRMCPSASTAMQMLGYDPSVTAYRPLRKRSTRVIQLNLAKGETDQPLQLMIRHINLDREFKFAGVSYTWEGQERDTPVQLWTSFWTPFTVYVTQSLIDALVRLRISQEEDKVLWVWVDQLSINQADDKEKAEQIALMGDIFSKANMVDVWLGTASADSDMAIGYLNQIHQIFRDRIAKGQECFVDVNGKDYRIPLDLLKLCIGHDHESSVRSWAAVENLLRRPWFRRIWVIQEVTGIPAEHVRLSCGSNRLSLSTITTILPVITISWYDAWHRGQVSDVPNKNLSYRLTLLTKFNGCLGSSRQPKTSLLDLLSQTRMFEATDPRDKLFCLIHSANDLPRDNHYLRVDYSQTLREVCLNYVLWQLHRDNNLDFLAHCNSLPRKNSQWPNWLPDLGGHYNTTRMCPLPFISRLTSTSKLPIINVGKPFTQRISIAPNPSVQPQSLALSGVKIGTVVQTFKLSVVLDPVWRHDMQQKECPLKKISMLDSFYQAAAAGDDVIDAGISDRLAGYQTEASTIQSSKVSLRLAHEFQRTIARTLFSIGSRESDLSEVLGLGPFRTCKGAEIWMFEGGQVLYMVVPTTFSAAQEVPYLDLTGNSSGSKHFTEIDSVYIFLGECFVPGLMQGEIFHLMEQEPQDRPKPLRELDNDFRTIHLV